MLFFKFSFQAEWLHSRGEVIWLSVKQNFIVSATHNFLDGATLLLSAWNIDWKAVEEKGFPLQSK